MASPPPGSRNFIPPYAESEVTASAHTANRNLELMNSMARRTAAAPFNMPSAVMESHISNNMGENSE